MVAPSRAGEATTSVMSFLDLMRLEEHQQWHFHTSSYVLHFINKIYVNREYIYNLANTLVMLKSYIDFRIMLSSYGSLLYINNKDNKHYNGSWKHPVF